MITTVRYEGYEIAARPYRLVAGGWTTDVDVSRDHGSHIDVMRLTARNVWNTEEEAVRQCLLFGAMAIDGQIPGCELSNL